MTKPLKNILAVLLGLIIGSIINMGIIMIGSSVIPPPEGVDVTNMESLIAGIDLFKAKHFISPFLAHSIGALTGSLIAYKIAASNKLIFSLVIGILFLIGGITNLFMLPSPLWFSVLDISLAYIPMAWIGAKLAQKF